jgi:hypothetical protein
MLCVDVDCCDAKLVGFKVLTAVITEGSGIRHSAVL